jgi:hypothetical protein
MTPQLDADQVARVVIPYFLRSLMRIERERVGLAQREASTNAGWSASLWGSLERGDRPIDREQWIAAAGVLSVGSADIVRRLNAFIHKYPSIWMERISATAIEICERPVTSPRIIRSGKVVNVDLNPLRPNLYHELSSYSADSMEIVAFAVDFDFYSSRQAILPSTTPRDRVSSFSDDRLEQIIQIIRELPQEKLGLMERIVDKFQKYSARDLAQAYQHFSLSIKKQ